jgi:putative ABC transport system ATP-binding protein
MYQLHDLSRVYRKGRGTVAALRDVNLDIEDGEFITIQGLTGHGKSTLLMTLGAMDRPTSGSILFDGQNLGGLPESRLTDVRGRSFGFIFQSYNLMPTLTAAENVEAALVPLHVPAAQRRSRALAALAEVGLDERAGFFPPELSGGEQQRVGIARALVKEPKVILADEPTGNLDETTRTEIVGIMERLWKDRGLSLIVVTHDSSLARRAPRTALLDRGRLSVRSNAPQPEPTPAPPAGSS